jgi:hypothetical protein
MALTRWVVDASPLILLGNSEQLGLLGALADRIAVPRAVVEEVVTKPEGGRTLETVHAIASFPIVDGEGRSPEIPSA